MVDLENDPYKKATDCYGLGVTAMISWIAGFTARATALTGKWPIIYTTAAWWRECTGSTGRFRHDPLWLAAFGGTLPTVPSPWPHWTFWQYDNAGFLPGIGQTDLDYYQPTGGLPALRAARRGGVAGPQSTAPKSTRRRPRKAPSGIMARARARASTRSSQQRQGQAKAEEAQAHHQPGVGARIRENG